MLAFTFPGQGSQQPGMGRPWVDHPSWALVAAAADASGRDVAALLLDADADELRRTENAQLSTYVLSLVVHDAVRELGVRCTVAAGHSLGEYTALTAVGALRLEDGVRLVTERGAAMQAAADARPGTMAAVLGADDDIVAEACAKAGGDVWIANSNGAGQVVIAGDPDAIAKAGDLAKELGARKVLALPVGGAFHTPFMAPAADRLRAALAAVEFADAEVPVLANVDALPHQHADQWAGLLDTQLTAPVRWRQTVERMVDDGDHHVPRARSRRRPHGHGQALRARRHRPMPPPNRLPSTRWSRPPRPPAPSITTRASTSSPPSASWSARPPVCSRPLAMWPRASTSSAASWSGTSPATRCGRRSEAPSRASSPSPASASPAASPWPGCALRDGSVTSSADGPIRASDPAR